MKWNCLLAKIKKCFSTLFMKLFILSLSVNLILFVAFLGVSINYSMPVSEKQYVDDALTIMNKTSEYLNLYIQNIKNMVLLLSKDEYIYSEDKDAVISVLEKYASNYSESISTIYLCYEDESVLCSSQTLYEIVGNSGLNKIQSSTVYESITITRQYRSNMAGADTIALIKPIYDSDNQLYGRLIVEIKLPNLISKLTNILGAYKSFVVLTENDTLLTDDIYASSGISQIKLQKEEMKLFQSLSNGVSQNVELKNRQYIAISSNVNFLTWKMIILLDKDHYLKNLYDAWKIFVVYLLIFIPVLFTINQFIIRKYLHPLKSLAKKMDQVDLNIKMPHLVHRNDEIGQLSRSFEDMLSRINTLLIKQTEDEKMKSTLQIELLQSQINPHFLSNSLSCVVMLLRKSENDRAIDALRQILMLLNYGLSNLNEKVALSRELDFISSYAEIHRMRRGNFFRIEYVIQDGCEDYPIPKLLLQPFIENSFLHGFVECHIGALIRINAFKSEQFINIVIEDNGRGFLDTEKPPTINGFHRRIGIENVRKRLELLYAQSAKVNISSKLDIGTTITINLPYTKNMAETEQIKSAANSR